MHLSVLVHEILEKKKKKKKKRTLIHNITLSLVSIHHNIRNTELLATLKLDLRMPGVEKKSCYNCEIDCNQGRVSTRELPQHRDTRTTSTR